MTLEPPITPDEEDMIRQVRSLRAKQAELAQAEADRLAARSAVVAERANAENLRQAFIDEMRKGGIDNPEVLLRERR